MESGIIFECSNQRQRDALQVLGNINIFDTLREFNPIWVGTIPLGIDIPCSDLDIICEVYNFAGFKNLVRRSYSGYENFSEKEDETRYVASFIVEGFEIEIYAESCKIKNQSGYRHMLIEHKLLELLGENFKGEIIALKRRGYKTEPAFGKVLKLENPYTELLELEKLGHPELKKRFENI